MLLEPHSRNKKILLLVSALVLIAGLGILISTGAFQRNPDYTPAPPNVPQEVTYEGNYICLSHKDSSGPQTLECALGIKANNGNSYSLDTSGVLGTDTGGQVGQRIRVSGLLTTIEQISSDQWQKYDVQGIIRVEKFEKISS